MNKDLSSYHFHKQNPDSKGSDDGFVKFLLDQTQVDAPDVDENLAFLAVKRKIEQPASTFSWMKIAASLTLLAAFSMALFYYISTPEILTVSSNESRISVTFPDGSNGVLNENSIVSYPSSFAESRDITLVQGEVFFEVKESDVPFSISAGDVDVTVLGTTFNLQKNKGNVRLDVTSGLVAFKSELDEVKVGAGNAAIYIPSEKEIILEDELSPNTLSWINGKFVFDNVALNEVLEELSTYYKVKFKLKNENLATCKISATFDNQDLSQVLETLDTLLNLNITRKGKTIEISGEGCQE